MPDEDLLTDFLAEAQEHLSGIEADLLTMEETADSPDRELVNKVFRAAHSIKGGSGFFNLNNIRNLAHHAETVLDLVRSQRLSPQAEVVNVLLLAFDKLRDMINNPAQSEDIDASDSIAALEAMTGGNSARTEPAKEQKPVAGADQPHALDITAEQLDTAQKGGLYLYLAFFHYAQDLAPVYAKPGDYWQELGTCGQVLNAYPEGAPDSWESDNWGAVIFGSVIDPLVVDSLLRLPDEKIIPLFEPEAGPTTTTAVNSILHKSLPQEILAPQSTTPENWPVAVKEKTAPVPETPRTTADTTEGHATNLDTTLRVSVKLLESLMNLASELVLSRNQLREALTRFDQHSVTVAGQRINLVTSELQEAIMQTRMQPMGGVFAKFPRLVRDLGRSLGKDINLMVEGREVELDKTLIEGLGDPLTHMVRNSADHGLETPAERLAAGKPATGTITLRAYQETGQAVIEVADDGRGIDPEKICRKAVERNQITPEQARAMSDRDKINLIFLPGFSTAQTVTDVSGRGVGMDVVKTNLNKLGGKVEIISEVGRGSLFRVKLPLTLAIIPSLILSLGQERFAVPQINVVELIRVPADQVKRRIEVVGDAQVLVLRGLLIPIIDLAQVLEHKGNYRDETGMLHQERRLSIADRRSPRHRPRFSVLSAQGRDKWDNKRHKDDRRQAATSGLNIAILSNGILQYGIVVQELHNTEEIVVKPLGQHLKGLPEYAGATIMGDGRVALILDVAGLATKAGLVSVEGSERAGQLREEQELHHDLQSLLLFHNGERQTCAVPLSLVQRVERIDAHGLEWVGGTRVMHYRKAVLPLFDLADAGAVKPLGDESEYAVIVFSMGGRELGLLGGLPVDVLETRAVFDTKTLRRPGVAASAVINGNTVLLTDVFELVEAVKPDWAVPPTHQEAGADRPCILLAEDSDFFRAQVKKFIESLGFYVLEAPDGLAAWELLQENPTRVGLLVTDVEMPRMDGLELTRQVRADQRFTDLPIIGLTSLAGEEDVRRGKQAGITDYQVKLDRDNLLKSISTLLPC